MGNPAKRGPIRRAEPAASGREVASVAEGKPPASQGPRWHPANEPYGASRCVPCNGAPSAEQPRKGGRRPGGHSLRSRHSRTVASPSASLPSLTVPQGVRLGWAPCRSGRIGPLDARPLRKRTPGRRAELLAGDTPGFFVERKRSVPPLRRLAGVSQVERLRQSTPLRGCVSQRRFRAAVRYSIRRSSGNLRNTSRLATRLPVPVIASAAVADVAEASSPTRRPPSRINPRNRET